MKRYTIVKFYGREFSYRVFGNQYGKTLEVLDGTDHTARAVRMQFSGYEPNLLAEACRILETTAQRTTA